MQTPNDKTQQSSQQDAPVQKINLSEYAGDEDDYNIAAEQANTYCEDCERAVGADKTTIRKDAERSE